MNKLYECIINGKYSYNPVWFMRQAGRYLPEFREIRKKNTNFIDLCLNPDLVKSITLQPLQRFDLDAAIIFSDILMVPYGLGQKVEFKKGYGPILESFELDNILKSSSSDFINNVNPVYSGIKKVSENTKGKSLIGFAGAPWTLLVYMLNKKSPKKDFNTNLIINDKLFIEKLIKKLEDTICLHIQKQVESGANVIQIFDSWAGLLDEKSLHYYCYSPTKNIVEFVKKLKVPVICFPRGIGKHYEKFCSIVKPDCISIDTDIDPKWILNRTGDIPIQGGMDPKILLSDKEKIEFTVKKYLKIFNGYPYIFNLGHGVLPETNPDSVAFAVETIRKNK